MQLIDGKKISKEIKDELKEEVAVLKANGKKCVLLLFKWETIRHLQFM